MIGALLESTHMSGQCSHLSQRMARSFLLFDAERQERPVMETWEKLLVPKICQVKPRSLNAVDPEHGTDFPGKRLLQLHGRSREYG